MNWKQKWYMIKAGDCIHPLPQFMSYYLCMNEARNVISHRRRSSLNCVSLSAFDSRNSLIHFLRYLGKSISHEEDVCEQNPG